MFMTERTGGTGSVAQFTLRTLCSASIVLLILLAFPKVSFSQRNELFDVKKITNDIKRMYNLSTHDVRRIQPVINQENKKVVKIYARFCGDEPEYSARMWAQIVEDRMTFESELRSDFTAKQIEAMRFVQARMEK